MMVRRGVGDVELRRLSTGVLPDRGFYERLERARVNRFSLVDVDRPSRVPLEAGIEEVRWIWNVGATGKGELHDLLVRLPSTDNAGVRPDRGAHPFPFLGDVRVGFQNQRPHAGQRLTAPAAHVADALIDQSRGVFRRCLRAAPRHRLGFGGFRLGLGSFAHGNEFSPVTRC